MRPADLETEKKALGFCFVFPSTVPELVKELDREAFTSDLTRSVYEAVRDLFLEGETLSLTTVTHKIRSKGLSDRVPPHEIAALSNNAGLASDFNPCIEILKQKRLRRILLENAELLKRASDEREDPLELLENAEERLTKGAESLYNSESDRASDLVNDFIEKQEKIESGKIEGLSTGLRDLDRTVSGFMNSDLFVLASRPGMGKTASLVQFALNTSREGAAAVFSLEMPKSQIFNRLVSNLSGVNSNKLRQGGKTPDDWRQLNAGLEDERLERIFIDDNPKLDPVTLRSKTREIANKNPLKAVFIDYLQLMDYPGKESRDEKIGALTRSCKLLAKELNIPVILYSQLNRSVETRGGMKKPNLSDLRESGSIEQDADEVAFLWWPDYYGIREDAEGADLSGLNYFIVSKNRHGAVREIPTEFSPETHVFRDL
jgi:replicative DNA helicase